MDFYLILGIAPDASTSDIKRAYRRLARRYHPGINPGDRAAEEMFRRIAEAYETLVDPGRRQQYDGGGGIPASLGERSPLEFTEFDFSASAYGPQAATFTELFADVLHPVAESGQGHAERGADLHASLTLDLGEAMRGIARQLVVTREVACSACEGAGRRRVAEGECRQCRATGRIRWARGHMVFARSCPACGGSGRQRWQRCAGCAGQGRTVRTEAVDVDVPPGTAGGVRLRVPGHGHAGRNGGQTGDLYVTVHVRPHALFTREGDDLFCTIPVSLHEAVLGARIEAPSLDGPVRLRIPPGTQAGRRLRVSGRGAPTSGGARGDLVFEVRIVLPSVIDERSRELMREFGARNPEDVRKEMKA
ncbi:MAG TPA: J domain-containing protein [Vicinamibacterales bacterium]|nr:J domain-containing protein [Vicinamibacterales bacterium]